MKLQRVWVTILPVIHLKYMEPIHFAWQNWCQAPEMNIWDGYKWRLCYKDDRRVTFYSKYTLELKQEIGTALEMAPSGTRRIGGRLSQPHWSPDVVCAGLAQTLLYIRSYWTRVVSDWRLSLHELPNQGRFPLLSAFNLLTCCSFEGGHLIGTGKQRRTLATIPERMEPFDHCIFLFGSGG